MKKAVLLLAMVTIIAGCIYLKNADKDTVLYGQQINPEIQYSAVLEEEYTEETISEEISKEIVSETQEAEEDTTESFTEDETEAGINESASDKGITRVIYEKLTQNEQQIYEEILESLLAFDKATVLSTTDSAMIDKVFTAVMLDNPEIFYVDGYKYTEFTRNEKVERIEFS